MHRNAGILTTTGCLEKHQRWRTTPAKENTPGNQHTRNSNVLLDVLCTRRQKPAPSVAADSI